MERYDTTGYQLSEAEINEVNSGTTYVSDVSER